MSEFLIPGAGEIKEIIDSYVQHAVRAYGQGNAAEARKFAFDGIKAVAREVIMHRLRLSEVGEEHAVLWGIAHKVSGMPSEQMVFERRVNRLPEKGQEKVRNFLADLDKSR